MAEHVENLAEHVENLAEHALVSVHFTYASSPHYKNIVYIPSENVFDDEPQNDLTTADEDCRGYFVRKTHTDEGKVLYTCESVSTQSSRTSYAEDTELPCVWF